MDIKVTGPNGSASLSLTFSEQEAWNLLSAVRSLPGELSHLFSNLIPHESLHERCGEMSEMNVPTPAQEAVQPSTAEAAPFVSPDAFDAAATAGQPTA